MKLKCPKCKSDTLNVSKSPFRKLPLFKIIIAVLILGSIWNLIASIRGGYQYTCANCGKRFK